MGIVNRRRGLLRLGGKVTECYCDKCGQKITNRFWDDGGYRVYCFDCANLIDLFIAHDWNSPENLERYHTSEFFVDTNDHLTKHIGQCLRCLGVFIYSIDIERVYKVFYQPGSPVPSSKAFMCIPHDGFCSDGEFLSEARCSHTWIVLATSKDLSRDAHEKYHSIMQSRNSCIEEMFDVDSTDYQYLCFGSTHYWCCRCGRYLRLNPQRDNMLPSYGRPVEGK